VIKKLEILANIAVVITSVVLCSVLVKKYFVSTSKPEPAVEAVASKSPPSSLSQRRSIQAGTKISLPGIDWSKSSRTILRWTVKIQIPVSLLKTHAVAARGLH